MKDIPFISREEFEASLHYGCHFNGYVEKLGYVYWGKVFLNDSCPSYPNDRTIYYLKGTNFVSDAEYVPIVIPEDSLMEKADISSKDILDAITRKKPDGSMVVTFLDNSEITLGAESGSVNVNIGTEYFGEELTQVVTITAEDNLSGVKKETKNKLKDVFYFLGEGSNYVSFLGPLEFHMGNYMDKVHRFRPITQGGREIIHGTSRYRYGFVPGKIAAPLATGLKVGGFVTGGIGLLYTGAQYWEGEISGKKAAWDGIFGVVGFLWLPGMVISLVYFITISPFIDDIRPMQIKKDWNDISLPMDNTRVVRPYEPIKIIPRNR